MGSFDSVTFSNDDVNFLLEIKKEYHRYMLYGDDSFRRSNFHQDDDVFNRVFYIGKYSDKLFRMSKHFKFSKTFTRKNLEYEIYNSFSNEFSISWDNDVDNYKNDGDKSTSIEIRIRHHDYRSHYITYDDHHTIRPNCIIVEFTNGSDRIIKLYDLSPDKKSRILDYYSYDRNTMVIKKNGSLTGKVSGSTMKLLDYYVNQ